MKKLFHQGGFTLTEMIIAITIFALIVVAVYSVYTLSHQAYREGERAAETIQNGRVVLERISREIRQAKEIVTELSDDEAGATSTILFQDGHEISTIHYINYFKEGTNVKREVIAYYFSGDPATHVPWDATPPPGQQKLATTTEEARIIGEYVAGLGFWGSPVINTSITLEKENKITNLKTQIFGRNL